MQIQKRIFHSTLELTRIVEDEEEVEEEEEEEDEEEEGEEEENAKNPLDIGEETSQSDTAKDNGDAKSSSAGGDTVSQSNVVITDFCETEPDFAVICSFFEKFGASCGILYPSIAELEVNI